MTDERKKVCRTVIGMLRNRLTLVSRPQFDEAVALCEKHGLLVIDLLMVAREDIRNM